MLMTQTMPMTQSMLITQSKTRFIFTSLCMGLLMGLLMTGCAIHRIDVQQGNVITPEVVEKLKIGMNRGTVKSILGTPPVSDPFHRDRWDYVYSMVLGKEKKSQSSHLTLLFEEDSLKDIIILKPPIPEDQLLKPDLQQK